MNGGIAVIEPQRFIVPKCLNGDSLGGYRQLAAMTNDRPLNDILVYLSANELMRQKGLGLPFNTPSSDISIGEVGPVGFTPVQRAIQGVIFNPVFFGLNSFDTPLIIVGAPGSGKSVLRRNLITLLALLNPLPGRCCVINLELAKAEDKAMATCLQRKGISALDINETSLKLNFCQPPCNEVSLEEVSKRLGVYLPQNFGVPEEMGGGSYIRVILSELLMRFKESGETKPPTIIDLYYLIKSKKAPPGSPEADYRNRWLIRLRNLISSAGQIVKWSIGYTIQGLVSRFSFINIRLSSLDGQTQRVIVSHLITQSELYKMAHPEGPQIVFAIDECHLITKTSRREDIMGETVLHRAARTHRGLQISYILLSQDPLEKALMSMAGTRIMMRLSDARDIQLIGSSIGMTPEQINWAKTNLWSPGSCIVSLSDGRVSEPLFMQTALPVV